MTAGRTGFFFWPYDPAYTARMAALGERLGFDLVGIADTPGNAMDMWVALGVATARTERVTLAACVTNFVSRHPLVTASAAASLDAACSGRFVLGVGTGHSAVVSPGATDRTAARDLPYILREPGLTGAARGPPPGARRTPRARA